jgi:hypothetical protein
MGTAEDYEMQELPYLGFEIQRQGLRRSSVAKMLHPLCEEGMIARWCKSELVPPERIVQLAKALGVEPEKLGAQRLPGREVEVPTTSASVDPNPYRQLEEALAQVHTDDARRSPPVPVSKVWTAAPDPLERTTLMPVAAPRQRRRLAVSFGMDGMPMGPWHRDLIICSCGAGVR